MHVRTLVAALGLAALAVLGACGDSPAPADAAALADAGLPDAAPGDALAGDGPGGADATSPGDGAGSDGPSGDGAGSDAPSGDGGLGPFPEARHYERPPAGFATVAECEQRRTDPLFNCAEQVAFCPDGFSFALFTDVVTRGRYVRTADTLTSSWEPGDVPSPVSVFRLRPGDALSLDGYGPDRLFLRAPPRSLACR